MLATAFSPTYAAFAAAGFMVALINYTGSIGYGEKYVQELRGKCGELDVQDCVDFVKYWEDKVGGLGPGKT
jgi:dipeptidyl aminopeptidase/acylaminoacyl peptidase